MAEAIGTSPLQVAGEWCHSERPGVMKGQAWRSLPQAALPPAVHVPIRFWRGRTSIASTPSIR